MRCWKLSLVWSLCGWDEGAFGCMGGLWEKQYSWMQLFCLQLEVSCLQLSFLLTDVPFSSFRSNWSFLLAIEALSLTVGELLLTMGKCV